MKKINNFIKPLPKRDPHLHSELHLLVDKARTQFGEKAKRGKGSFGFYLAFFKRLGLPTVYRLLAELKQEGQETQGKLFWAKAKRELEKQKEKKKNRQGS